jgi:hypothetical protein
VVVRFAGEGRLLRDLPGALSATGGPREWSVICNGAEAFVISAGQLRCELVEESGATLRRSSTHASESPQSKRR